MTHAKLHHWLVYHPFDSRHSAEGWPDLFLCRALPGEDKGRCIAAELKSEHGKASAAQIEWLDMLSACPGIEVALWRPRDWPAIEEALA